MLFGFLVLFQLTLTFTNSITCRFYSKVNANFNKFIAVPLSHWQFLEVPWALSQLFCSQTDSFWIEHLQPISLKADIALIGNLIVIKGMLSVRQENRSVVLWNHTYYFCCFDSQANHFKNIAVKPTIKLLHKNIISHHNPNSFSSFFANFLRSLPDLNLGT